MFLLESGCWGKALGVEEGGTPSSVSFSPPPQGTPSWGRLTVGLGTCPQADSSLLAVQSLTLNPHQELRGGA